MKFHFTEEIEIKTELKDKQRKAKFAEVLQNRMNCVNIQIFCIYRKFLYILYIHIYTNIYKIKTLFYDLFYIDLIALINFLFIVTSYHDIIIIE